MKRHRTPFWLIVPIVLILYWWWTGTPLQIGLEMFSKWWPVVLLAEVCIVIITPALNDFQDAIS